MGVSSGVKGFLQKYSKEQITLEAMQEFLHMEQLIQDDEAKLGDILAGMSETIHTIIDGSSTIYGEGVNLHKKETQLRAVLLAKNIVGPNNQPLMEFKSEEKVKSEMESILQVFAYANQILKVLINDHIVAKDSGIEFHTSFHKSYDGYMKIIQNYNEISANIDLELNKYRPKVDSIIEQINHGKTHVEKRDGILLKLLEAFKNILKRYQQIRDDDAQMFEYYRNLNKVPGLDKILLIHTTSKEDVMVKEGISGDVGIIASILERKKETDKGKKLIEKHIQSISQTLQIENEMGKIYQTAYDKAQKVKKYSVA